MTSPATITTERRGHVLMIGLDRAAKRNAFNLQMLSELAAAYNQLEDDPELRCGLLFAHGDHFTAGLDLAEVGPAVGRGESFFPPEGVDPLELRGGRPRTKPMIIAVQGWCLTIGVELLLACDIRLAADDTRFSQMEVKRGIMPFGGATVRLHEVVGWGNAMRYLLTGDIFDAAEALRIGLVQEVLPADQVVDKGLELAQRIAAQAPLAVQASLASARMCVQGKRQQAIDEMMEQTEALMRSEDAAEGLQSFVERREARFKGR